MDEAGYRPGACNIGDVDVRTRARLGRIGVAVAVVVAGAIVALDPSPWWSLLVAPPAYVGATGLLQARARFCVGHAAAGRHGFGDAPGPSGRVEDEGSRAADRARARELNGAAARWTILAAAAAAALAAAT